jgi:ABC-type branched-subunit amino acid transport system substrate-binding protein
MRTRLITSVVCVLLVAACGTTAKQGGGATTSAPSTSGGSTTAAADSTAPATTAPAKPVTGVDDTTVKVGFIIAKNQAEAQAKLGTKGITFVDHNKIVTTLVDDINSHGGLDGKKIVPVLHVTDELTDTDPAAISRSECATFTEDNKVYAVLSIGDPGAEVLACLNKAGVPLIASSGATFSFADQSVYDANPLFFNPSGINLDSAAKALIEGLNTAGFFTSDAKVGLIRLTSPEFDAAAVNSLDPALKAAGITPVATATLATIKTNDDIGRFSTEAAAAVLKMKQAGVTHLVFFESGGAAPFFFLSTATSQGFTPKLGFSSLSGGQTLVQNIKTGGTNVAWSPIGEVPDAAQLPESPAAKKCLDLIDSTRALFTSPNATSETLRFCDATWLLQAGVAKAGAPVAAADLAAAIESLGDTYQSPAALKSVFGPHHHDGVAEYYITDYNSACGCNKYRAGGPTPIS